MWKTTVVGDLVITPFGEEEVVSVDSEGYLMTKTPGSDGEITRGWTSNDLEHACIAERERASRFNNGKPKLSYIPTKAQEEEARVWEFGAKKYGRCNWEKGLPFLSVVDSILRHATAYQNGETNDPESGLPHMAHIRCNTAMLIEFEVTHKDLDDRRKRG